MSYLTPNIIAGILITVMLYSIFRKERQIETLLEEKVKDYKDQEEKDIEEVKIGINSNSQDYINSLDRWSEEIIREYLKAGGKLRKLTIKRGRPIPRNALAYGCKKEPEAINWVENLTSWELRECIRVNYKCLLYLPRDLDKILFKHENVDVRVEGINKALKSLEGWESDCNAVREVIKILWPRDYESKVRIIIEVPELFNYFKENRIKENYEIMRIAEELLKLKGKFEYEERFKVTKAKVTSTSSIIL